MSEEYTVDETLLRAVDLDEDRETGIVVRARQGERWGSYDIAALDDDSLLRWLRSRGGRNEWAENVVGILLGRGPLTKGVSP